MIYAHLAPSAGTPRPPTLAERLHAHADAVEHAAALGGWMDPELGRRSLSEPERARWAADAAVLREAAYAIEAAP